MNDYKIISSYDMGMQVSFGMDSKISEESIVWQFKKIPWRSI